MRSRFLAVAAVCALALAGCSKPQEDKAFGEKVRAYLLEHPEVIQEAIGKLQDKQIAQAREQYKAAIVANRQALERDPRDFVANPNGKITVTEFYDYRCAHCINAAPKVLDLIKANPDIRFVFKELPIFGAESDRAARAAIAVKAKGGDYVGLYQAFMSARPLNDGVIDATLRKNGIEPAAIDTPEANRQLADIQKLASKLGIEGTPAFVVGDRLIPGEDIDALKAGIAAARNGGKS